MSRNTMIAILTFAVALLLTLKYEIDTNVQFFSAGLQLVAFIVLLVSGGLIAISFCSLLGTLVSMKRSRGYYLMRRISEDHLRNFLVGFFATAYLGLIRPPLVAHVLFLPYVEWVVIVLIIYGVYNLTRLSLGAVYVSSESLGWRRHIQEIRPEAGYDLMRVTSVMERFIEDGVKEPLLVYFSLHLQRLGATEEDILKMLSPLIDYQQTAPKNRLYLLLFRGAKREVAVRNRQARNNLLDALIEKIGALRSE